MPSQYVTINISNILDVKYVSKESFSNGDVRSIEIWDGFTFSNLFREIVSIIEKEKGEKDFNVERILFYTKDGERIDFGCDYTILKNKDFLNVAIIEDDHEQLKYSHGYIPYSMIRY
jgi:hypothetical protein